MFRLHVLVDGTSADSFMTIADALQARDLVPIRLQDASQIGVVINQVKVSAVFLDWDAVAGGAAEAVRFVRQSASNRRVPITVMTASLHASSVADAHAEGANFFLGKPIEPAQLSALLDEIVPVMEEERRAYQRLPLSMPVLCKWMGDGERHTGEVVNISASGMLMTMWPRPDIGTRVQLAFGMQEFDQEYVVPAEVVRTQGDKIGVRYLWQSQDWFELLKDELELKRRRFS